MGTYLGNLEVFRGEQSAKDKPPRMTVLPPSSDGYIVIASVIDLGLCMMETVTGKEALVTIGCAVIDNLDSSEHVYIGDSAEMMTWATLFLQKLRSNFPPVVVTNMTVGEGEAVRSDWARTKPGREQGMSFWKPEIAGMVVLKQVVR